MNRLTRFSAMRPRRMMGLGFAAGLAALCVALVASLVLAVTLGPADISPVTAWRIGIHQFWPDAVSANWPAAHERIVWHIRLPRALLAALVGATLAVVGAVLQAMVRNPLADPTILGGTAGAASGAGLGTRFLRHLARTRVLVHLVDVAPTDGSDPVENATVVERELFAYSPAFRERPIWLAPSKMDVAPGSPVVAALRERYPERPMFPISSVAGTGVAALTAALMRHLDQVDAAGERALTERISADVLARSAAEREGRVEPGTASGADEPIASGAEC